jgi:signal transduction histidine kinase
MLLRGLSGPLAPRTGKYVSNVRAAGDRLLELVNGLLDFTRLEAGAERLEVQLVNLPDLVRRTADRCRAAAESKQLALQVSIDKRIGQVRADDDKLQHVLRSYLGNAIKFTPEGGTVEVHVAPDPRHEDAVRVSVSDSGIGMRDEQLARVWERFYQGDASLTRPYGGMGLGLSIARHLVLLHGGEVGAESSGPGEGSTFWFSLPKGAQPEPTPPRTTRTAPPRAETPGSQSSDRVNRSPTRR